MSLKLTKLHFSEIKEDICVEAGIISSENHLTLQCPNNQLIILDLLDSTLVLTGLFFNINYFEIPKGTNNSLLKKSDLRDFYKNSALLDQQSLTLEPSCVAQFSCERLKLITLQFKQSQWNTTKKHRLAVIVTTGGLCRILQKLPAPSRNWGQIYSVDEYFFDNMLSLKVLNHSDNDSNEWGITAADWHKTEPILFVSFENGYIGVFTICISSTVGLNKHFLSKATLEKICDITSFDNYLLVSSKIGGLQLFSLNFINNSIKLMPLTILWNRRDNMICRRVLVSQFSPSTYLIVCHKGVHILLFILALNGDVLCSTQLYIGGIKVTGYQFISPSEFIVTNITSSVRYFRVQLLDHNKMKLDEKMVEIELGSPNLGIIGFVTSASCNLLTFVLNRNAEYSQHCKYLHNSIFVNISKLERINENPSKPGIAAMNPNQGCAISLDMDLLNNTNHDQNRIFSDSMNIPFTDSLSTGFLLQLQTKFVLVSNFLNIRRLKRKKSEELTTIAQKLLFNAIQICHIIYRLKHLLSLEAATLSWFQRECINVFVKRYAILTRKFKKSVPGDGLLQLTTERFISFFKNSFDADMHHKTITWNERCVICHNHTNPDTMMCERNHKVKRCYVSFKQLILHFFRHFPLHSPCTRSTKRKPKKVKRSKSINITMCI
ncbi:uncharacterized protein [Eurosta solidaginis]|uniref:uncharacterized protein isoform X2 n=1 Tax=Eurosta solidaginis TaxID=178769 RepID=UPI0035309F28